MRIRRVTLTKASIAHGRIYFSSSDVKFFPADAFADRSATGIKGQPVRFEAPGFATECDIRILSSQRLSPRSSFAKYLDAVGALENSTLLIERTDERVYSVTYERGDA